MIRVSGINAAVLFHPGSGQALLAFVLERKLAVRVFQHAKHKEHVNNNVAQAIKTLGLAPDRRQAKPPKLVAWETARSVGGSLPAAGGAPATAALARAAQPKP